MATRSNSVSRDSSSANTKLELAVAHALSCLKLVGFTVKEKQLETVKYLSEGHDVFGWFPTGYGKSLCYQMLPFVFDSLLGRVNSDQSIVLVVSPLVSLMVDQVSSLRSRGVAAAIMSSNREIHTTLKASESEVRAGRYRLLYCSPEAVVGDHSTVWSNVLLSPSLSKSLVAITVDEVHCVYKW